MLPCFELCMFQHRILVLDKMHSRNSAEQSVNDGQTNTNNSTAAPMKCYYGHYRDGSLERTKRQKWEQEKSELSLLSRCLCKI